MCLLRTRFPIGRRMIRKLITTSLLGCICVVLQSWTAVAAPARLDVGAPAPTLSGTDLTGAPLDITALKGAWVYVDFWATWCGPCMNELPSVVNLHQSLQSRQDFRVLSVSLDESPALGTVQNTAKNFGINYPVIFDGQGWRSPLAQTWGITAIPATFLINPAGEIVARDVPPSAVEQLIGRPTSQSYKPMHLTTSEEILPDSPSTGRQNLRDIRISLDFDPQSFLPRKYYLYVACGPRPAQGQPSKLDLRYEVSFTPDENKQHYFVKVERATGVSYLSDVFKQLKDIDPGSMSGSNTPDISVEVELAAHRLCFNVPLPIASPSMSYALSLYDENLGQYVNNGLTEVNLVGY
jgi:thiol-disulfide isomerase/thioredoxin